MHNLCRVRKQRQHYLQGWRVVDNPTRRGGSGKDNVTYWVGSLWHWQFPELRALVIIFMMTDIQCGEEIGKKPQDVDNGQLVGRIRLWGESNQALDRCAPA